MCDHVLASEIVICQYNAQGADSMQKAQQNQRPSVNLAQPAAKVVRHRVWTIAPTLLLIACLGLSEGGLLADSIKSTGGLLVKGQVVERTDTHIVMTVTIGGRTVTRRYAIKFIHSVTIGDKSEVLNPLRPRVKVKPPAGSKPNASGGTSGGKSGGTKPIPKVKKDLRTKAQVDTLIDKVGRTPPSWFDSTPLNYPPNMDLSWPRPPPKGWNNQNNVGQYVWDIINPNPKKWRQGLRLMHHLLSVNRSNSATSRHVMKSLGRMYFDLLQDYPRAAFWWKKAGVERDSKETRNQVRLAECYWRLGSRTTAFGLLNRLRSVPIVAVKLWADMGQTDKSVKMARLFAKSSPTLSHTYTGDAYRMAGRYPEALAAYQKALATKSDAGQGKMYRALAQANIAAIRLFEILDIKRVPNGVYKASSLGFSGQVQVTVRVKDGRITNVAVGPHKERQFYSAIEDTTRKILAKQSLKGIDTTSAATVTSEAIINATAKALSAAMK
jgi:uncharacterized protein with FMN-binding domain